MNIPQVATSMHQGHDALAQSGFKLPVLSSEGTTESGNWKIVGSESQVIEAFVNL
jgi:hypothetical protein